MLFEPALATGRVFSNAIEKQPPSGCAKPRRNRLKEDRAAGNRRSFQKISKSFGAISIGKHFSKILYFFYRNAIRIRPYPICFAFSGLIKYQQAEKRIPCASDHQLLTRTRNAPSAERTTILRRASAPPAENLSLQRPPRERPAYPVRLEPPKHQEHLVRPRHLALLVLQKRPVNKANEK